MLAERPQTRGTSEYAGWHAALSKTERIALKEHQKAQKVAANGGVNPDARWNAPEKLRECPNCHKMHVIGGQAERECLALIAEHSPKPSGGFVRGDHGIGWPEPQVLRRAEKKQKWSPPPSSGHPCVLGRIETQAEMIMNRASDRSGVAQPDRGIVAPMAAKKTPTKNAPEVNKSQYIRDRLSLTPAETIAEAKKAGITLTTAMVYSVRSDAKKRSAKAGTPKTPKPTTTGPALPKVLGSRVSVEVADDDLDILRKLKREYGTRALRAMMEQIERE